MDIHVCTFDQGGELLDISTSKCGTNRSDILSHGMARSSERHVAGRYSDVNFSLASSTDGTRVNKDAERPNTHARTDTHTRQMSLHLF